MSGVGRLAYFARSAIARAAGGRRACPNCGRDASHLVQRKYIFTELRRCESCLLLYRTPTDDPGLNRKFYQSDYAQGFTTDLPSPAALEEMKANRFIGTEKDYSHYVATIAKLTPTGGSVFDYGCSWGYGSYQIGQAGFDVASYELSEPRGAFGRTNLGVNTVEFDSWVDAHPKSLDAFFSAHVLEHVPSPTTIFDKALRALKDGGVFIAFFPNGSASHRAADPRGWTQLWGQVHPNLLDEVFWTRAMRGRPALIGSSPVHPESLTLPAAGLQVIDDLSGDEMFVIARA